MTGADIAALRSLGREFAVGSRALAAAATDVQGVLTGAPWTGPDASDFGNQWDSLLRPHLVRVSESLASASDVLARNADEQEQASNSGGDAFAPGGPVGPTPPTGPSQEPGCVNDCKLPGPLGGLNDALGSDAARWTQWGLDLGATSTEVAGLAITAGAWRDIETAMRMALRGDLPFEQLPGVLDEGMELVSKGTQIARVADTVGNVLGGVGLGIDALSLAQNIACGNVLGAVDDGISMALGAVSFVPGPVGWVATGLSIGWGLAQAASGDVPVTQRIGDFFSGLFK